MTPTQEGLEQTMGNKRPRILIVDDSDFILQLLEMVFHGEGFETLAAIDGQTAVRMARERRPDVVLLDVRMPHMDGWDVLETLRGEESTRSVPVMMTSTVEALVGTREAWSRGADAYLMKPFSPAAAVSSIQELLGSRGSLRLEAVS